MLEISTCQWLFINSFKLQMFSFPLQFPNSNQKSAFLDSLMYFNDLKLKNTMNESFSKSAEQCKALQFTLNNFLGIIAKPCSLSFTYWVSFCSFWNLFFMLENKNWVIDNFFPSLVIFNLNALQSHREILWKHFHVATMTRADTFPQDIARDKNSRPRSSISGHKIMNTIRIVVVCLIRLKNN